MSRYKLTNKLIELSNANNWDQALEEWSIDVIEYSESPEKCACGKFPIKELCWIKNRKNYNKLLVGNCCVKKFMKKKFDISSDLIFQARRRVSKSIYNAFNRETIFYAEKENWINEWEKDFYFDTMRKHILSTKQMSKRASINQKIMYKLNNSYV